ARQREGGGHREARGLAEPLSQSVFHLPRRRRAASGASFRPPRWPRACADSRGYIAPYAFAFSPSMRLLRLVFCAALGLVVGAGCGDAPRDNPLDPLAEGYRDEGSVSGRVTG